MTNKIELYKALLKFQSNVSNIQKDTTNPFFNSKYASLGNILDIINDVLSSCGLVVMQSPGGGGEEISLCTEIIHAESGESINSCFYMTPVKKDPQGIGSCITYMRRYALAAILKLNVDDDDGNAASNKQEHNQHKGPDKQSDPTMNYDYVKTYLQCSMTADDLKENARMVHKIDKTPEQRKELLQIYKDRMAFLMGEE